MFHIGIDIGRTATDCVLIDQAEPGAAVAYQMARALAAKDCPADGVMAGVAELAESAGLGQRELLARTTQFCKGTGQTRPDFKVIRIHVIRPPAPGQDQQELWRKFLIISHELLHAPERPRQVDYRKRLGSGNYADSALTEGVVSLLTEMVWSDVLPWVSDPASRAGIGGESACELSLRPDPVPRLAFDRYASMAEFMRVLHVVGSAWNVFAAFFLGEVEKVTGPVSLAVMGSPRAPLPAGEVAALVARLNAVPALERQRLRISLFACAPQEEIGRLLAEPGAEILAVWTADGTSARAASQARTPSQADPPAGTATPVVPASRPPRPEGDPDGAAFALPPAGDSGPAQTCLSAADAALPARDSGRGRRCDGLRPAV
jgi:hypothetical protein